MKKIYEGGLKVNGGITKSNISVIKNPEDIDKMVAGNILVLPTSDPFYALAVFKATGLICENGGLLSHICVVALEMGIPCITQAVGISEFVENGQVAFMDADLCRVEIDC